VDAPEITDIEQLAGAPPHLLRQVIDAVDVETWGQALFGTSRTVQAQFLPHFSPADADDLTRWLSAARPVRLRDLDAAQERVLQAWRELRQDLPLANEEPAQTASEGAAAGTGH
jgi:flagellar motor switch protein FliG